MFPNPGCYVCGAECHEPEQAEQDEPEGETEE